MNNEVNVPEGAKRIMQRFAAVPLEGLVERHNGEWIRWEDFLDALPALLSQDRQRVLEALRALESQSVHMEDPSYVKTPVSAFVEFRLALTAEDPEQPALSEACGTEHHAFCRGCPCSCHKPALSEEADDAA